MTDSKPKILLTNDDGIDAEGIQTLRRELENDYDVLVVAPLRERSGSGCGLTLDTDMAVEERRENGKIWGYGVDGTPADCVKYAVIGLEYYKPDLVLSGANRGSNLGNSIFYSGTVAATIESAMRGLKAMAISVHYEGNPNNISFHFSTATKIAKSLVPWLLEQPWEARTLWNLNTPNLPFEKIRGLKFAHQGTSYFIDNFTKSKEEEGIPYYRNSGDTIRLTPEPIDSDDLMIAAKYASMSLLKIDLTVDIPPAPRQALEDAWAQLAFGDQ